MGSGIREAFVSRPGWVFCSVDFSALECVTFAQTCIWKFGYSKMADAINNGDDMHCRLAARIMGVDYAKVMARKKAKDPIIGPIRFTAKAGNFGFLGGMGPAKFVVAKRQDKSDQLPRGIRFCELLGRQRPEACGDKIAGIPYVTTWNHRPCPPVCPVCCEVAAEVKAAFVEEWDARPWFQYGSDACKAAGPDGAYFTIPGTQVLRGPCQYASFLNGHFQGLAAVGAKRALYTVTRACYTGRLPAKPATGAPYTDQERAWAAALNRVCRPVAFVHDEIISEIWLPNLHEAATAKAGLMINEMQRTCPDVKVTAEPAAALRLYKAMEAVYVDGRLVPWAPKQ